MEGGESGGASGRMAAEDEAAKRNTDCVYFLASPLTCKKGSECEYRHSEGARVNPRDCWYWLNGNCLNPKCSFRHPPLDALYGPTGTTSGPAPPLSQTVLSVQMPSTHASAFNSNKQSVPCYYFQKGGCLKGDRCPFIHGPQSIGNNPGQQTTSNSVPQQVAKVPSSLTEQSETLTKASWGIVECTTQLPKISAERPTKVPCPLGNLVVNAEASSKNGLFHKESSSPYVVDSELPKLQPCHVPLSSKNAPSVLNNCQPQPLGENLQNGREESSPGFDVIVDDDDEDINYLHNEDEYGRVLVGGGRNSNPANDSEYHHADYEFAPQVEKGGLYNGMGEYERDGRVHNRQDWEQHRRSSERVVDRQLMHDRRVTERDDALNEIDGSDLRHRLLKQRRLNVSRSVVSPDRLHDRRHEPYRRNDRNSEDRHRGRSSDRNHRQYPQESSISTRLRGRITVPRRLSPDTPIDYRSRKERERGRHRGRLSPAQPINNYQDRHHDRRAHDELTTDVRNSCRQPIKRDDAESPNFAGPKSLAELKSSKFSERLEDQTMKEQRNMKSVKSVGHQESEASFSFKGPEPFNIILKRKRETMPVYGATSSSAGDEIRKNERKDTMNSLAATASSMYVPQLVMANKENIEEEEEEEEGLIHAVDEEIHNDGHSFVKEELELEDGMIADTLDDHNPENDQQRDEESDYEVNMDGDFRTENDSLQHDDEDDLDDDDDDDFAKKIGMILS